MENLLAFSEFNSTTSFLFYSTFNFVICNLYNFMKLELKNLFPKLKKISHYSDYCNHCHKFRRDLFKCRDKEIYDTII